MQRLARKAFAMLRGRMTRERCTLSRTWVATRSSFLTHQAFVAYDDVPAINAIVVSCLHGQEVAKEVKRWAGFFACRVRPTATKPPLVLIATRSDHASTDDVHNVEKAHQLLRREFADYFEVHQGRSKGSDSPAMAGPVLGKKEKKRF